MKMDYVKTTLKKTVKPFLMLMIEEIKYVMKEERLAYSKFVL